MPDWKLEPALETPPYILAVAVGLLAYAPYKNWRG